MSRKADGELAGAELLAPDANGTAGPCDAVAVAPLRGLLRLLRPRTIARTIKTVDDLGVVSRDLKRLVKQLELDDGETVATRDDISAGCFAFHTNTVGCLDPGVAAGSACASEPPGGA